MSSELKIQPFPDSAKPDFKIIGLKPKPTVPEIDPDLHKIINLYVSNKTDQTEPLPLVNETEKSETGWKNLPTETPVKDVTGISKGTLIKFRRAGTSGILEGEVINFVKDQNCSPNQYTLAPQVRLTTDSNRIITLDAVGCNDLIIAMKS